MSDDNRLKRELNILMSDAATPDGRMPAGTPLPIPENTITTITPERLRVMDGRPLPGEEAKIPIAPSEPIYAALSAFFGRLASADGLQNPDERTAAQFDATLDLVQSLQETGACVVDLGPREK